MILSFFKKKLSSIEKIFKFAKFAIGNKIKDIFSKKIDESSYEELERLFYESDIGVTLSIELVEIVKKALKKDKNISTSVLLEKIHDYLLDILDKDLPSYELTSPIHVILIVGVNGSGKTTSIAKLANHYQKEGKKVLIAAADTFRAAAVEQLNLWAKKISDVDLVKSQKGSDPSSVVFDALTAAKQRGCDLVLIDTAGRLHTKDNLLEELEKMKRVCKKIIPSSPHETLLTLDATIGQNAIDQAFTFNSYTPIDGIILSKLDGSAKGGIIIAIKKELNIPVKWVGMGEKIDDLYPFQPKAFIDALLAVD